MKTIEAAALAVLSISTFSCASTPKLPFNEPNALLRQQIDKRVNDLRYTHGVELMNSLDWLARCGELAFYALIEALESPDTTTRSSAANILGRGRDRRVIPYLQKKANDPDIRTRFEVARALLRLGDWSNMPILIAGLRDTSEYVRALCNDALKSSTQIDFGFVPSAPESEREPKVQKWEGWWQSRSKDFFFAAKTQ